MKSYRFSLRWFFIDSFLYERYENEIDTNVFASSALFEAFTFLTLKDQFQNLTSDQVRSRSGHDFSKSIFISFQAAWRAKSFGNICVSISPCCRELLAKKNGLWPRWPSRDPRSTVAPGSSQMGWVVTILNEMVVVGWFMQNRKHFHISS